MHKKKFIMACAMVMGIMVTASGCANKTSDKNAPAKEETEAVTDTAEES